MASPNSFVILDDIQNLRSHIRTWRMRAQKVAFVPTMGALHDGHISLIRLAAHKADKVVVSIFVNPAQFGPNEDFLDYPRDEAADMGRLADTPCDLVYRPRTETIYPSGNATQLDIPDLSSRLEGGFRPQFFAGVLNVVVRLFLHVQPDIAIFGEKDYQQLQIIRRMTLDLGFPTEILAGPTLRENDGLAMASRNLYLSDDERKIAGGLYASMNRTVKRLQAGAALNSVLAEACAHLHRIGFGKIDYFSLCCAESLEKLVHWPDKDTRPARLFAALWLGKTRLIDNMAV